MNRSAKIQAARAATRERMRSQTVTIDEHWRIVRADPMNWEIQRKTDKGWKFQGYYGTIVAALQALPVKMLSETAKNTLSDVLRSVEGIRATIDCSNWWRPFVNYAITAKTGWKRGEQ